MLSAIAALSCLGAGASAAEVAPPNTEIRISRATPGHWRVGVSLTHAVERLAFFEPSESQRAGWQMDAGFVLDAVDGRDGIHRGDGRPFRSVRIDVDEARGHEGKGYTLFVPFTDGSRLVYASDFLVYPARCGDVNNCGQIDLIVKVPAGERVAQGGRVATHGSLSIELGYVFVGHTPSEVHRYGDLVLDPGFPGWLADEVRERVPAMMKLYAARFGENILRKPLYFAYDPSGNGYAYNGGVAPGAVEFSVQGPAWKSSDEDLRQRFLTGLVAHELAHLWNADLFRPPHGISANWVHEGGADALASWVSVESGIATEEQWRTRANEAIARCERSLAHGSIHGAAEAGDYDGLYSCGAVTALLAGAVLNPAHPSAGVADLWQRIFENTAAKGDQSYGEWAYQEVLASGSQGFLPPGAGDADSAWGALVVDLHVLVEGPVNSGFLERALARAGLTFDRHFPALGTMTEWLFALPAIRAVVAGDCGANMDFSTEGSHFLQRRAGCAMIPAGWALDRVGDLSVAVPPAPVAGLALYAMIAEKCAVGGTVEMTGADGVVLMVPCNAALPTITPVSITAGP